jgi:hypothetical protein
MLLNSLYISNSKGKGRGVFTDHFIEADSIIEIAPVIILNEKDSKILAETELFYYNFQWGKKKTAMALGYGSIYNHSYSELQICGLSQRRIFAFYHPSRYRSRRGTYH